MNNLINLCVIGAGRAGMIHALNFQYKIPGVQIKAIVDSVGKAREEGCKKLNISQSYSDYKHIISDKEIDGVIITLPTRLHKNVVVECAKAKKHILCEKPMAMTADECDEMIKACKDNNVILQIGFMRRFDRDFIEVKKAIKEGAIGDVVQIRSMTRGPSKPQEWMYDIKRSNGPLAEVNSHDIDCVRWLAESDFDSLYAIAGNYRNKSIKEEYPDFYDNVILTGKLKNGIQICIEGAQYVQYGYDARLEVLGTEGVLFAGRPDANQIKIVRDKQSITSFVSSWTDLFEEAYLNEDRHFIDCILYNKMPDVNGNDGKMAVKIVEAGNKSILTGQVISLKK